MVHWDFEGGRDRDPAARALGGYLEGLAVMQKSGYHSLIHSVDT